MLAPSSGGVFEPHTIHMPYLFSAQCMLTDSVITRVLHVIIMMHGPQSACQKSRIGHTEYTLRIFCKHGSGALLNPVSHLFFVC